MVNSFLQALSNSVSLRYSGIHLIRKRLTLFINPGTMTSFPFSTEERAMRAIFPAVRRPIFPSIPCFIIRKVTSGFVTICPGFTTATLTPVFRNSLLRLLENE